MKQAQSGALGDDLPDGHLAHSWRAHDEKNHWRRGLIHGRTVAQPACRRRTLLDAALAEEIAGQITSCLHRDVSAARRDAIRRISHVAAFACRPVETTRRDSAGLCPGIPTQQAGAVCVIDVNSPNRGDLTRMRVQVPPDS